MQGRGFCIFYPGIRGATLSRTPNAPDGKEQKGNNLTTIPFLYREAGLNRRPSRYSSGRTNQLI